jgi:hypothetical protein
MDSLRVNWHLCSDHKLVALFWGFGGAGCKQPCFMCLWDRTKPRQGAKSRTVRDIQQKGEWAEAFFLPIHKAQGRLKSAKETLQLAKKRGQEVKASDQAVVDDAMKEREDAFQRAASQLNDHPDHDLVHYLLDAQRLQRRIATTGLPKKLLHAAGPEWEGLRADLQAAQNRVVSAEAALKKETARLCDLEIERDRVDEEEDLEEELEALVERIDLAQSAVDAAEEKVAGHRDAWDAAVDQANAFDKILVRVEREVVKLYNSTLQFKKMGKTLMRSLLVEACEGIYRGNMVNGFIPPDRWYIEPLHLLLNTGNAWLEVACNLFHYLLNPDGTVRDRSNCDPNKWPLPSSGSRQSKGWREKGFDLEALLVAVLGDIMFKPLTKYHGAQIEIAFKRYQEIFEAAPLAEGIAALERDDHEARELIRHLKNVFCALSEVHKQVSSANPSIPALQRARDVFSVSVDVFEKQTTPLPCRYRLKFYDHAVLEHVVPMSKQLKSKGLSLAVVSSKFLEANNKVVKAVMRRLPGGGKRRDGTFAHLPLVQGLKRCIAAGHVRRQELYKAFAEGKDAGVVDEFCQSLVI